MSAKCSGCRKTRASLSEVPSRSLPGVKMFLCAACIAAHIEPRGFIILAAKKDGLDSVTHFIKQRLYYGDPIAADEII